ncbi:LPD7 domain-containing protein [Achromobacter spanius]|uniref:LPD7 domain-containing protein n=1 Tax=Achromobacter spanius TaxID=217203 RepID=UPI00380864D2
MATMAQKDLKAQVFNELTKGDADKAFAAYTSSTIPANAKNPDPDAPGLLALAAARGHGEFVKELISRGAAVNAKHRGVPVIQYAATAETVRALAAAGADVNAPRQSAADDFPKGTTALHIASSRGDMRLATALVQAGADPLKTDSNGATAADLSDARIAKEAPQAGQPAEPLQEYTPLEASELGLDQTALEHLASKRKANQRIAQPRDLAAAPQPKADTSLNSIEDARFEALPEGPESARGAAAAPTSTDRFAIPTDLKRQFVEVNHKFFYSKAHDTLAFHDKGTKLETPSNSEFMAENLVRIAELRGWTTIKVSGSEEFRRQAWMAAEARGIAVVGFKPKEIDKGLLEKKLEAQSQSAKPFRGREKSAQAGAPALDGEIVVSHGPAPYEHKENNSPSYFVTTTDPAGNERTYWGVDLDRAMSTAGAAAGDRIKLENLGKKQVTVEVPVRNDKGEVVSHETKQVHRNEWQVTVKESFEAQQKELLKKNPGLAKDMAANAGVAAAIDKRAQADGLSAAERQVVQERVQANIANSIERGNPPRMSLKEKAPAAPKRPKEATLEAGR